MTVTGSVSGGTVWGSGPYTIDSDMGRAALHAGLLTDGQSGAITITEVGSLATFTGSTSNGVTTTPYGSFCGVQISLGSSTPNDPCPDCSLISFCNTNSCTSTTFCTGCISGYGLSSISAT